MCPPLCRATVESYFHLVFSVFTLLLLFNIEIFIVWDGGK
jgi:hypothetical protein